MLIVLLSGGSWRVNDDDREQEHMEADIIALLELILAIIRRQLPPPSPGEQKP